MDSHATISDDMSKVTITNDRSSTRTLTIKKPVTVSWTDYIGVALGPYDETINITERTKTVRGAAEDVVRVDVKSISGGFDFFINCEGICNITESLTPGLGTLTKMGQGWYRYLWAIGDCMFDTETIEFDIDDEGTTTTYQYAYEYTGGTGCCGETIGYTTQSMTPLEEQTLTVVGGYEERTYDWEITAGGGTLSSATGESVTYTAPATNTNCANNPTITLSVDGEVCDTLQIAVNAHTGTDKAYVLTWSVETSACNWAIWAGRYRCTGVNFGVNFACDGCDCHGGIGDCNCGGGFYCLETPLINRCNGAHACGWDVVDGVNVYTDCNPGATDVRPVALKALGCCPEALL